jgi:hypothetical protein
MKTLKWLVGLFNRRTRGGAYRPDERAGFRVGLRFDLTNPEAVKWAATSSMATVPEIDDATRAALRQILAGGFREGNTVASMAREMRSLIRLTPEQESEAEAFRREQTRALCAKHPRTSLVKLQAIAEKRVDRYRRHLLQERTMAIAHTQTILASSWGSARAMVASYRARVLKPSTPMAG